MAISAWKWCGADPTRWVRSSVSSGVTISRPFFHPLRVDPPSPGADGHPSARARLHSRMSSSLTAPTPMAVSNGPYTTITVINWSRVDAALG